MSLVLVAVLFVVGFRTTRRPLLVVVALLFGVSWTLGAAALWPGHLTLLSASFASILVGLGVDYGIHIVARIEEWVAAGLEESRAATRAVEALAASLTTAALTSAAVFYAMLATGFRGFAELGFIAGSGILLCLVANVTVLPALLIVLRARAPAATERAGERWSRALGMLHSRPFAVALLLFGLVSLALPRARFESNYLALQPRDSAAVRWERKMIERSDLSPQFAIFLVDSARDAQELTDRLLEEDLVGEVHSLVELETLEQDGFAVPQDLVRSLQTEDGGYAVYAYPEEDLWADQDGAFVERMLAIDPQVTGMPILGSFMIESSLRAMRRTAWLSAALLLLVVGLSFRDLRSTLLALVPVSLAAAVLPTVMRWLGLHWNPIDVMAVPVILGIAVDDGVHLVHRFHHERGDIAKALAGSGRAIVLTSATTLAAFGSLSLAQHRGLASFAMVLSLGVILALVFTLVVLPPLLTWSRGATVTSTRTGNAAVRTAPLSPNRHPSRTLRQVVKRQRPNPVK
jgi:predicted RND superfamily exporter protein